MVELAVNPAEFGKLAARQNLVEIAEACWGDGFPSDFFGETII